PPSKRVRRRVTRAYRRDRSSRQPPLPQVLPELHRLRPLRRVDRHPALDARAFQRLVGGEEIGVALHGDREGLHRSGLGRRRRRRAPGDALLLVPPELEGAAPALDQRRLEGDYGGGVGLEGEGGRLNPAHGGPPGRKKERRSQEGDTHPARLFSPPPSPEVTTGPLQSPDPRRLSAAAHERPL